MEKSTPIPFLQKADAFIADQIYVIRNQKVMLDKDLAKLYGVETRVLKQAIKRNLARFPTDFMFELSDTEMQTLVSQNVIPDLKYYGGAKPFVFTEQGVAMLSSILNSSHAIMVNIQIIRIFTRMRQLMADHTELYLEMATIKDILKQQQDKQKTHDQSITTIFNYLDELIEKKITTTKNNVKIGYKPEWDTDKPV